MTSSSDSELLQRRRLFVGGLPTSRQDTPTGGCHAHLQALFGRFGPLSHVHASRRGFAFVTFEEEAAAERAIGYFRQKRAAVATDSASASAAAANPDGLSLSETALAGNLVIEYSLSQRPLPVTGARRVVNFPRPFTGRRAGPLPSPSTGSSPLPFTSPTHSSTTGASRGSRSGRARGVRQQRHGHGHDRRPRQLFSGDMRILHFKNDALCQSFSAMTVDSRGREVVSSSGKNAGNSGHVITKQTLPGNSKYSAGDNFPGNDGVVAGNSNAELSERYQNLFRFHLYPHIAKMLFDVDAVTLLRCLEVCRAWRHTIAHGLERVPRAAQRLRQRWRRADCSFRPLRPPPGVNLGDESQETTYRNVLSLKCDSAEILLALDNGNVEIYDRYDLSLKCVISGQFVSSPSVLDFDEERILVSYTCGFGRTLRRSPACWNVFCRRTKRLLTSIEREDSADDVRLGFDDGHLYLTTPSAVYCVQHKRKQQQQQQQQQQQRQSARMRKLYVTHESDVIEALDIDRKAGYAAGVVRSFSSSQLMLHLWRRPPPPTSQADGDDDDWAASAEPAPDFMTHLVGRFPLFPPGSGSGLDQSKCKCLSVQLRHPLTLSLLSNTYGFFEYFEDRGKPYVLLAVHDVTLEQLVRVIRIDDTWMHEHNVVPYDYDSGVLTARFDQDRLVVGMGSYAGSRDSGLAMWEMDEVLDADLPEHSLHVYQLPAPAYHWHSYDGHTGGVVSLHVDKYQLVSASACLHQVATRCIEVGDESRKDNVMVYDFGWRGPRPAVDGRRRVGQQQ